mmetsp:Transcript_17002/g.26210  ORF Transcript_17002/g.26210 Transcript_17002/m.26210 type:complete len:216 (+) Transcript_17002:3241-3888(+)
MMAEEGERFKMKAKDVYELQEMVKANLDQELSYDQYMSMFKPDIPDFVSAFNELQDWLFNPRKTSAGGSSKVSMGALLTPQISEEGEFEGFRLRSELMNAAFSSTSFNYNYIRRVFKACLFMNKLFSNGGKNEFILKKLVIGEKDPNAPKAKANKSVLVRETDFADLSKVEVIKIEEEEGPADPYGILPLLKGHAIGVMSRNHSNKRTYYEIILE